MNLVRRACSSDARQPENYIKLILISYKTKISSEPEISHRLEKHNSKSLNTSNLFLNTKIAIFWKDGISKIPIDMWEKTFFQKLLLKHDACTRYCSQSSKYEMMVFLILKIIRTRDIPIIFDPSNITLDALQPQPKPVSYPRLRKNLKNQMLAKSRNLARRACCSDARQAKTHMKLFFTSHKMKINPEPEISQRFEIDYSRSFNTWFLFWKKNCFFFFKKSNISKFDKNYGKRFFQKIALEIWYIN